MAAVEPASLTCTLYFVFEHMIHKQAYVLLLANKKAIFYFLRRQIYKVKPNPQDKKTKDNPATCS